MDLNETKRKRQVPDWMKSPSKPSAGKSTDVKVNASHIQKSHRPSYPPISIKKTKQPPKSSERRTESGKRSNHKSSCAVSLQERNDTDKDSSSEFLLGSPVDEPMGGLDDFCMTVDDLTRVAQEIIDEEQQK